MRLLGALLLACSAAVAQESVAARDRVVRDLESVARSMLVGDRPQAVSVALVDHDPAGGAEWSWAAGFGSEDAGRTRPATGASVYRAGAVGTLVTAAAHLSLVGQGRLDRDAGGDRWDPVHAAAAVARVQGASYEQSVHALVFAPLGLRDTGFDDRADLVARTVAGALRGWDGAFVPDPGLPATGGAESRLRASAADLARFGAAFFPHGSRRLPLPEVGAEGPRLGSLVSAFEGRLLLCQRGAVHGAAVELAILPTEGVAVAVAATCDAPAEAASLLVERALHAALAVRTGRPLDPHVAPQPVGVRAARRLAGRYRAGLAWFDLREREGELIMDPCEGAAVRLRWRGRQVVGHDGSAGRTMVLEPMDENTMRHRGEDFVREPFAVPPDCPADLRPFLGEYGDERAPLVVFEDDGRLVLLVARQVRSMPERVGEDRFRLASGPGAGELLTFERDASGLVVAASIGTERHVRRPEPPARKFRITPLRPVAELRAAFADAVPPVQPQGLRASDLVDLRGLDPTLRFDVRYATEDNFLGAPVYDVPGAMLQRPAAAALLAVHRSLARHGLGLCIFDGYRPWRVTKLFWEATPPALREFVADPANGSRHNRGCAVDLSLFDLATGELVDMPSDFDEFTWRAYSAYPGGSARQRWNRELLRTAMEPHGFAVIDSEWWHFDFHLWREYPVLDEPLR